MKKFFAFVMVFCAVISMTACGSKKKESKSTDTYNVGEYVKLGDYSGLKYYKVEYTPTDDDVQSYLDSLAEENATYKDVKDRASVSGDYVTLSYSAVDDAGAAIDSCKGSELQVCLGQNEISADVEKALEQHKAGDSVEVATEIPESLDSKNQGKSAVITFKIAKLQTKVIPKITDGFIVEKTEYNTVEEYKEYARKNVKAGYESDYYNQEVTRLLKEIVDSSKFDNGYPDDLYKECKEDFDDAVEYYASMFGTTVDDYLKTYEGMSSQGIEDQVLESVHEKLVIKALAKKLKISPTEKELNNYVEQMAKSYGYKDVDSFKKVYSTSDLKFSKTYNDVMAAVIEDSDGTTVTPNEYNDLFNSDSEDVSGDSSEVIQSKE